MATATQNVLATKLAYADQQYPSTHYTLNNSTWYYVGKGTYNSIMLIKFGQLPTAIKHNKLIGLRIRFQVDASSRGGEFRLSTCDSDFNANTVTYYTAPQRISGVIGYSIPDYTVGDIFAPDELRGTTYEAEQAGQILNSKSCCLETNIFGFYMKPVLSNGNSIYAEVKYDDAETVQSKVVYRSGPASGYYNPRNSAQFTWAYEKSGTNVCADETWVQSSATFYWKATAGADYTAVQISGTTTGITIPANTFPTATAISWYVEGTDEDGTTTQTDVFTFSTAAGTAKATARSPINTVEDGSAPITFRWDLGSTDGQTPIAVDLSWKKSTEASDSFHVLLNHESGAITSYTASANTFPAGTIEWIVRAYNVDDVAGPWSAPSETAYYSFICVAAPSEVEGLSATPVPYTTISWQSSEQQAYEITIDGVVVQHGFGSNVYSWTASDPLFDGDHDISVRVQGLYGLWSQPSTITVTIQNNPSDTILLQGESGIDARLRWSTESGVSDFYIYRDGERIGHTSSTTFRDRMVLGNHGYYVINKLADGNYIQSNTVAVVLEAKGTFISLLNGSDWLEITQSENSASRQSYQYSRKYALNHYSGAVYPVLELSPFEDFTGSYDFACKDYETARAFESYCGKEVIIKSRGNVVVFGAMVSLSSRYGDFINGYTFNIQRIHVEDYVDDTNY